MPGIYKIRKLALGTFDLKDDLPGSVEIHKRESALRTSYGPEGFILCSFSGLLAVEHLLFVAIILHLGSPYV